ncbi:hypothetical protein N9L68_03300 [bacterium]|nr:hypothetical protein [bacterium]
MCLLASRPSISRSLQQQVSCMPRFSFWSLVTFMKVLIGRFDPGSTKLRQQPLAEVANASGRFKASARF